MTTQPSEQPAGPFFWAGCPICGSEHVMRLPDNWQEQVEAGAAIPIVGCGNPWHYFLDREAAAPDPVASPTMLCGKCQHPMHWRECGADADLTAPCRCRNDVATLAHSPMVHDPNASLYAPVASPALDVERLARVLRYSPMHWEVRRPDGAFVMTRMFSDADEAAQAIARDYEAEGQPVAEEPA